MSIEYLIILAAVAVSAYYIIRKMKKKEGCDKCAKR